MSTQRRARWSVAWCRVATRQADQPAQVTAVSPVYVANQFGWATLDVRKPFELCVPALAAP